MIATVTLNPALDLFLQAERIEYDAVLRASGHRREAGGKGVNVSRVLRRLGHETLAVVLVGGPTGQEVADLARNAGIPVQVLDISENTRINVHLEDEASGRHIKVNMPGPAVPVEIPRSFPSRLKIDHPEVRALVLAGSLPPGARTDAWRVLIEGARDAGLPAMIDSSGAGLRSALRAQPQVLKINRSELGELTRESFPTTDAVRKRAEELRQSGIESVCVTLGSEGAVLVDETGSLHAPPAADCERAPRRRGRRLHGGLCRALAGGRTRARAARPRTGRFQPLGDGELLTGGASPARVDGTPPAAYAS